MKRTRSFKLAFFRLFSILIMVGSVIGPGTAFNAVPVLAAAPAAPAAAITNTIALNVISARSEPRAFPPDGVSKGDTIANFKYIINEDNTGTTDLKPDALGNLPVECSPVLSDGTTPNPDYPNSCPWLSIAGSASYSSIFTQGNQSDFPLTLPDGRYLISVLADGYRLDGAHFTIPLTIPDGQTTPGVVTVELQPFPLPDATIRTWVFEDISPTNGAPDAPVENGLGGFQGHIADYIGEVTTDVYGNPLCTRYVDENPETFQIPDNALVDGAPVPRTDLPSGVCLSKMLGTAAQVLADPYLYTTDPLQVGMLAIPHVGPNRYALSAVRPDGTNWIQTTTLEGNHDWDAWVMEGATGYDTEFVVAGEVFPATFFGFVQPTNNFTNVNNTGSITSVVTAVNAYVPPKGGITGEPGLMGAKVNHVIDGPWISLSDLNNGDTAAWIGQGDVNGKFTIPNVPDGDYSIAVWDEPQDYILSFFNVTVRNGETVDLGATNLNGWWTTFDGYVFNDLNANGRRDPGEPGMSGFPVAMRKRENSLMDRGAVLVSTDADGYYFMENAYPMTQWLVMEAYTDLYYTTGVTYQADNQAQPTTVLGQGVDVNVLPIIGLGGRMDWGVHAYDGKGLNPRVLDNGGIVGSVSYDTTRNELDPRYAFVEDWQPGIPGMTVNLYRPIPCGTNGGAQCDASGRYELADDGSFAKSPLLDSYITETWERPTGCVGRDVNGDPLLYGIDQSVLPYNPADPTTQDQSKDCIEAPLMGIQYGPMIADGNFGASVNGNFGFGDLDAGDYIVEVVSPTEGDVYGAAAVHPDKPIYQVTREEDINIANGDQIVPQVPPPQCVGPMHIVDVKGILPDGPNAVDNPTYATELNGSYYEGQPKPLCNAKLVTLSNGKSTAPLFTFFTEVPIPGRFWGLLVDNLNFSSNPKSQAYGEKAGVPFAPVGIYDFNNRLVTTVESDYNGLWDVLLPSTNRINCPTPSGVCAGMYRAVGNDPGTPGQLNTNYNPQFRTIAAEFEVFPGLIVPADLAPTQVGVVAQLPGGQVNQAAACLVNDPGTVNAANAVPEFYAIDQPYMRSNASGTARTFTIQGMYFGATQGTGKVTLSGIPVTVSNWSDTKITFSVPSSIPVGANQLVVTSANGKSSINGLSFQVLPSNTSNNQVYEVGPGRTYAVIQDALDAAAAFKGTSNNRHVWVVVYPGQPDLSSPRANPRGAYYENLIVTSPVVLQGVGPGSPVGSVPGSIIDGSAFGGDTALADVWRARMDTLAPQDPNTGVAIPSWVGNPNIYEGQTIYLLALRTNQYSNSNNIAIDGFDLRGGDQMGQANTVAQGGAIFANAYINSLQITNNLIENNSGTYGSVRIGTPDLPDEQNDRVTIAHNRIIANAGTNLAGGIGLFAGSERYEVAYNDICGNFSAEYGGGISHYGLSPMGSIHDNRIYFNQSYDEGGGILIAGALPVDPAANYGAPNGPQGSGPVDIYNNLVQSNLSNDDGGGIRFLMAGRFNMNVYNNMIVNNVSTHEGGGISLNDAPTVNIYNNTIMKNQTTATALTSTGIPAPAGLSTSVNSTQLQQTLPGSFAQFSNPVLFNNIFWDNRAGSRGIGTVFGLGLGGAFDIYNWDMGVAGAGVTYTLAPTNSIFQATRGTATSATNQVGINPLVIQTYDTVVTFQNWRTNTNFIGAAMVAMDLPATLLVGDYHIQSVSPAINAGTSTGAPAYDYDNEARVAPIDIGADEITPRLPTLTVLDTFNRANANNLGANWSPSSGNQAIRVNDNQAIANATGQAIWNNPTAGFGTAQAAAFTFVNITVNNAALILKASGGTATAPASYIQVLYNAGQVTVATTVNSGGTFTTRGTLAVTYSLGDTLTAIARSNGSVEIYRNGKYAGTVTGTTFTGSGRIGMRFLASGIRVDNFSGGTLP